MKNLTKVSLLGILGATLLGSASAGVLTPLSGGMPVDSSGTQEFVRIDHGNGQPSFIYRPVDRSTVAIFLESGVGDRVILPGQSRERLIRKEIRPGTPPLFYYRATP